MKNEMVMDQPILFHKPNKNSEEWENDGLAHYSNQTPHKFSGMILFSLVLTNYEEWDGDRSTHSITQTKQKNE
jgi:hypothetical protein